MLKLLVFKYQPIIFLDSYTTEEEARAEARFYIQAAQTEPSKEYCYG